MKCPICRKDVPAKSAFMPFCSERCKVIDLGNWATEKYVISTPVKSSEAGQWRQGTDSAGDDDAD